MKRSHLTKQFQKSFLAVSASALMLGAAHAGTTIGLNFQSWYYDSGATPQTVGFGVGYQTTGFPVTAKAFGVSPANWVNTDPLDSRSATVGTNVALGSITATLNTVNMWQSDIGNLVDPLQEWVGGPQPVSTSSVLPGNDEVTWSFEDNTGWTNSLSGMNAAFPNGYVIELIAAGGGKCTTNSQVVFTDGATTFTNGFKPIYTAGNVNFQGPVGLLASPALASDSITFGAASRSVSSAQSCSLAGFILTDQPVVTKDPANVSVFIGAGFTLTPSVIGLTNGLGYQWQHAGTNITGANGLGYTNPAVSFADVGNYDLVATNLYGSATSGVAVVTVLTPYVWKGNVNTTWDINGTANWNTNGVATLYVAGAPVLFDDTAATPNVVVAATVSPLSLTVTNDTKSYVISGAPIAGTTGLVKFGTNDLSLSGANTFTGDIAINAGSLTVTGNGTLNGGSYVGQITDNGKLNLNSTSDQTLGGVISGNGGLTKGGTGMLTLSVVNTYTGGTTVNAGTLALAKGGSSGTLVNNLTINPGATVNLTATDALGYNVGSCVTNVNIIGGTLDNGVIGNNAFITSFNLTGGTMTSSGGGGFNLSAMSISSSATSVVSTITAPLVIRASPLTFNVTSGTVASGVDIEVSGTISGGGGSITKAGAGTMLLSGNSLYSGSTLVSGGHLFISGSINGSATVATNTSLVLIGTGSVNGQVTTQPGGSLSLDPAGMSANAISSLALNGNLTLRISKTGGTAASDQIIGMSSVTYGGKLTVANVTSDSSLLALGDSFQLFPVGITYAGSFNSYQLPVLPAGLTWDVSQFAVNGTLAVTNITSAPTFSPAAGNYYGAHVVTISSITAGAVIYYTTNGTTPTAGSPHAASPVTVNVPVNTTLTINAYALAPTYNSSPVQTATYNTTTPQYASSIIGLGPVAYWPLNEANGPAAFDIIGGYNGTYGAGVSFGSAGPVITGDPAITTDATVTGVMLTPYAANLNPAAFTVTGWVNPLTDLSGTTLTCALSCGQFASSGRSGWLIYQSATGWSFRTFINQGTTAAVNVTGATQISSGTWYHLAATWDGTTANLYVNGVLDASQVPTTTPKYVPGESGGFAVGMRADNAFPWLGSAADVALFNRVLSATQIAALATNGVVSTVNTTPINIGYAVSGNTLTLSWPADHTGWTLQSQTNTLNTGLSGTWYPVSGSSTTNSVSVIIDPTKPTVFYRLTYP